MTLIALELQREAPADERDQMIDLCCEYFESALETGGIRIHRYERGVLLYFGTGGHLQQVVHCPACGFQHAPSIVVRDYADRTEIDGQRVCGRCREPGHYASTCSGGR